MAINTTKQDEIDAFMNKGYRAGIISTMIFSLISVTTFFLTRNTSVTFGILALGFFFAIFIPGIFYSTIILGSVKKVKR